MDNIEKLPTFGTQNTRQRRTKQQQNHNTICVGYHYMQTKTNNVNKTLTILQTTGGKTNLFLLSRFIRIIGYSEAKSFDTPQLECLLKVMWLLFISVSLPSQESERFFFDIRILIDPLVSSNPSYVFVLWVFSLLDFGTVPTVWYFLFSIRFWNCSDSVVFFIFY
jgi:hypothetical protein